MALGRPMPALRGHGALPDPGVPGAGLGWVFVNVAVPHLDFNCFPLSPLTHKVGR